MLLNEESRIQITFYGLGFPNCVSAIFHFSLFTFHYSLKEESSLAFGSFAIFKTITDNADATDLFFHGFLLCCWISLRLSGAGIVTDYLLLEESCAVQAQIQSERNPISSGNVRLNEIREKIKSVASVIRELFERVRTEPKAKEHNNVVLSSRQLSSP